MLQQGMEGLSKRRRAKKARLHQGGELSQQEAHDLQDNRDIAQQLKRETHASSGRKPREETRPRLCDKCSKTRHNARTCQISIARQKRTS